MSLLVPATAIAEAQAAMRMPRAAWAHIYRIRGLSTLDLHEGNADQVGDLAAPRLQHYPMQKLLTGPLMVGHVLREAIETNAAISTQIPELYGGHSVPVVLIEHPL
ncbi:MULTISPECIES: hypothetical protein [Actinoplanes]|uniref:hypothetical protein n=1 Tax=Actinoplanes TaxID=1865 RepID=UPI000B13F6B9|nr:MULTISPECIES: hypothetical protein [Actinoplanes]GLY00217.1 hypothetical protein Acsp01_05960 [Actinoplanes sp. NBRC 101535]